MDRELHNEEIKRKKRRHSEAIERERRIKRKKKHRVKKIVGSIVASFLVSCLMAVAALSGIYVARIYTTPYSSIASEFNEDTLEYVRISKEKCNILVMGTDKEGLRTDVMMIAQIDPEKGTATVMSIPRDTRVKYRGGYHKINEVHAVGMRKGEYGSEASILAIKELTGIPIHHFVKVNFDAFRDSIDELGGVDFDVPQRMKYTDPYQDLYIDLQKGMQHLDGDKAEQLVRFRRYKNGDLDRIKVQQDFIHALAEQKLQMKYIGKVDDIYEIVTDNMETSMSPANVVACGKQLLTIGKDNITTITMPGTADYINGISYVLVDKDGLQQMVKTYFGYGKDGNEIN